MNGPLTIGTAGHVDHGKTALVRALTGVETDRLPEERARGLTIVLGYAPLRLPSGRRLSVVDVPGHERFVRTMVAGAGGIDAFLMVIAADDGVMPQTIEHATVLRALGIERGVVAVSKADLSDPADAARQAGEMLPDCPVIACSAKSGQGLQELVAALEALSESLVSRAGEPEAPMRLHVDRAFTIDGRGTVVTGTLWSGAIALGASLELAHADGRSRTVRVRGLQVHDSTVDRAEAGQRVAVNLIGVRPSQTGRGDVLLEPGVGRQTQILDCALTLKRARHGERVQVHHGTRDVPGRLCSLEEDLWQLRLERPLVALDGDRLVVRRLAPPDTLGGGRILDAAARRHGARAEALQRLRDLRDGRPVSIPTVQHGRPPERIVPRPVSDRAASHGRLNARIGRPSPAVLPSDAATPARLTVDDAALAALDRDLRHAGAGLLSEAQLEDRRDALRELRSQGRAVRVSGRLYAHVEVLTDVRRRIVALLEEQGSAMLADVRDALGLSRKSTQAFLEHLDAARVTRRLPDDRRVLR